MAFKVIQVSVFCLLALQNKAFGDHMEGLPGPMEPGMSVRIIGAVSYWGSNMFDVNFLTDKWWNDYVPFHMKVRYNKWADSIHFNTWKIGEDGEGYWEEDEKVYHGVPARYGRWVQTGLAMRITARENDFHVFMNGKEMTFEYRVPKEELKDIKHLLITDSYTVESITWERQVGENKYEPY